MDRLSSAPRPPSDESLRRTRFNVVVNLLDGAFFGFALGMASSVAILPLFIDTLTDSSVLIGLLPSIHIIGWQLPQILTSKAVARRNRFKPMVLALTIHERLPFFGLAILAWFVQEISNSLALSLVVLLLVWQGVGGGVTATAWQSMIGKIIPPRRHGLFYGLQGGAANLMMALGAVLAGLILERISGPGDYALIFLLSGVSMAISWIFLALTRELEGLDGRTPQEQPVARSIRQVLGQDRNFRWFLVARSLSQFATIAFAFYTIYAVRRFEMSEGTAGLMAGLFAGAQIGANPVMGWIGDRWGHRSSMVLGLLAAVASAVMAWMAPGLAWFGAVFILAGIANAALWTVVNAMTLAFGSVRERPMYIGLANSMVAPFSFLAPVAGGWLADSYGFAVTFQLSALLGMLAMGVFLWLVRDPKPTTDLHHRFPLPPERYP